MQLSILVYLFCFYNNSFNIVKQSIACAFILLFYQLLLDKKIIKAAIIGIFACLFHVSAILAIIVIIAVLIISKSIEESGRVSLRNTLIVVLICIVLGNLNALSSSLVNMGVMPQKYATEIFQTLGGQNTTFYTRLSAHVLFDLCFRIALFVLPIVMTAKTKEWYKYGAVRLISLIGVAAYTVTLLTYHTVYGGRITLYMDFFYVLWVPSVIYGKRLMLGNKNVTKIVLIMLLFLYWFGWVMVAGWSASNHYVFRF